MARSIKTEIMKNKKIVKRQKKSLEDKKPILTKKDLKITKLFDEIDTGVSYDDLLEEYGY